jgi:mannose-6-phosphate isomerase-like protein (cupin superfamily)
VATAPSTPKIARFYAALAARARVKPELFTDEGCFITELYNLDGDAAVSVARARVQPGMRTALHTVAFIERYVIEAGQGLVTLGEAPPFAVGPGDIVRIPAGVPQRIENTSTADLVFLCICTPRFSPEGYRALGAPERRA